MLWQNGATGTGGTYAFKKGWEGAWEKECDLAGLGKSYSFNYYSIGRESLVFALGRKALAQIGLN